MKGLRGEMAKADERTKENRGRERDDRSKREKQKEKDRESDTEKRIADATVEGNRRTEKKNG